VPLPQHEAAILSGWLRELAIQPGVADTERARFGATADTIDRADL
jgi:hypothetical protein